MNEHLLFILIATSGAVCMEAVHWYDLRNTIEEGATKKILFSKYYWIITIIMILLSGVGTYALFYEPSIKTRIPFVLGAAFPLIFKKAVSITQKGDLGSTKGDDVTFEKVFKTYIK